MKKKKKHVCNKVNKYDEVILLEDEVFANQDIAYKVLKITIARLYYSFKIVSVKPMSRACLLVLSILT